MRGLATEQNFFYNQNAIEIKSNVWMEWNYNAIIQPFATTTSYAQPVYIGPSSLTSSNDIPSTRQSSASSKISMNQARAIPVDHYNWNASAGGRNFVTNIQVNNNYGDKLSATYTSPSEKGGYFKIIFYVKGTLPISDGNLADVVSTSATWTGLPSSNSVKYLVQSVGKFGQVSKILNASQYTLKNLGTISSTSSVKVTWTAARRDGAIAYNVFRQATNTSKSYNTFAYLGTVARQGSPYATYTASYSDQIGLNSLDPFKQSILIEQNSIKFTPKISLQDNDNNYIDFDYNINYYDPNNGNFVDSEKTINLDGTDWQKIELFFKTNSSQKFKKINISFIIDSPFLDPFVQIGPMWLYEVSESDYYNRKYFPLDSIFTGKRPGEALLNPFLNSYNNSDGVNFYYDSVSLDGDARRLTDSYMNVSNIYEKTTDGLDNFQIIPSSTSKYKYYISDIASVDKGISAYYDQYLSVNKIYIKMNDVFTSYSTAPNTSSFTIYFNKADGSASSILLTGPFSFDSNGISVFYYKDNQWLNAAGDSFTSSVIYAASSNSVANGGWLPPAIGNNGQIASAQLFTQMTGLAFKCNFTQGSMFTDKDDNRLHLIEISPRLEIDITDYVESYSFSKELTNEDSGNDFPLGFITSNSGEVTINNFPVYYNNKPFSIFENKNNQTFLYDLLTQGVKLTGYFRSTTDRADFTSLIPSFVIYSEDWEVNDINNVTVKGFDSMKTFLMSNESVQYVAAGESLEAVIKHLLALAGFSDYSAYELRSICKNRSQFSYFWTEESKTVAQCLQEIFISNQIGCFIDETGFMRFIDIDSIINKKLNNSLTSNIDISDVTSASFGYLPNLITDSYEESLGTTIGKVIVNYNLPNSFTSPVPQIDLSSISEQKLNISTVYSEESKTGLGHSYLTKSLSGDENSFTVTQSFYDNPKDNPGIQAGNFFIGCEAVKTDGMQYSFVISGSPGYTFKKNIRFDSDIDDAVQESIRQFGRLSGDIKYTPTGLFMGVTRGCYGTKVKEHPIITNDIASNYFYYYSAAPGQTSLTSRPFTNQFQTGGNLKITTGGGMHYIAPTLPAETVYDHFSLIFQADTGAITNKKIKGSKNAGVGFFYNFDGSSTAGTGMIFIEKDPSGKQSNLYLKTATGNIATFTAVSTNSNLSLSINRKTKIPLGKNLFDGLEHRISVWKDGSSLYIRVDDFEDILEINGFIEDSKTYNSIPELYFRSGFYYGFFFVGQNVNGASDSDFQSMIFKEFYACDYPKFDDGTFDLYGNPKYHIQCQSYLTNMMNINVEPSYYLWQNYPKVIGFKYYQNEKYQAAPALPDIVNSIFTGYDLAWKASTKKLNPSLSTNRTDLARSIELASPFSFNQIIINNTSPLNEYRTIVFTKTDNDTLQGENNNQVSISPYQIQAQKLYFSTEKKYERVIDPNHINNSISMTSRWIQSEKDARQIVRKISSVLPQFNSTLQLSIFGNPLIQIGDVAGIWYSLKNLGFDSSGNPTNSLKYFITKINNRWDGGLETQLSLKPIK